MYGQNEEWRISRDKNKIRKGIEDMKRQEQEEEQRIFIDKKQISNRGYLRTITKCVNEVKYIREHENDGDKYKE